MSDMTLFRMLHVVASRLWRRFADDPISSTPVNILASYNSSLCDVNVGNISTRAGDLADPRSSPFLRKIASHKSISQVPLELKQVKTAATAGSLMLTVLNLLSLWANIQLQGKSYALFAGACAAIPGCAFLLGFSCVFFPACTYISSRLSQYYITSDHTSSPGGCDAGIWRFFSLRLLSNLDLFSDFSSEFMDRLDKRKRN